MASEPEEQRKVGWLHLKPEYIAPLESVSEEPGTENGDREETSKKRKRGQNHNRKKPKSMEDVVLCPSYAKGIECPYGDTCKFSHSITEYLAQKDEDIANICPVFEATGKCNDGWRCRFLSGHLIKAGDEEGGVGGYKVLVDEEKAARVPHEELNRISFDDQKLLRHNKIPIPLSETYLKTLVEEGEQTNTSNANNAPVANGEDGGAGQAQSDPVPENTTKVDIQDNRATYIESPLRISEKRKINWSRLKVLAPLTTLGNPPFRRLCRSFGAQLTYSEMTLSSSLLSGQRQEWALIRSHPTETARHKGPFNSYYGIQIAGGKLPTVVKTTELLTRLCGDMIDTIDLNCGCPLDMVCRTGAGSMLLENQGKLLKMVRGMATVSGDIPVTCKIRMGWSNGKNTAAKLVRRLVTENTGVSAITLHGRSRQQRYSRAADWEYISECAAVIKRARAEMDDAIDSSHQDLEYGTPQEVAFIGNGDVYSYVDFYNAIEKSGTHTSMIARGAIIKPWVFEEIEQRQHIDKSAPERLEMLKQFAHWGLEHWGSDEFGVSTTRRFFCEFMSFFHRYVPLGILDHSSIPQHIHDRAPRWCGRSDLETLLGSTDSRDWVKVSEMFLGKTPEGWNFTPKHKSNSVEAEG